MSERKLSYVQAFIEAIAIEMEADPDVFVAGEDVGAHGGVFHTFDGLQDRFGEQRAVDTPISEQAIVGLGVGAAVTGLRPIVDLMFMDFTLVAADQIVNQAAKLKYMFGGQARVPMVITTTGGGGLSASAQHSRLAGGAGSGNWNTAHHIRVRVAESEHYGSVGVVRAAATGRAARQVGVCAMCDACGAEEGAFIRQKGSIRSHLCNALGNFAV